MMTSSSLLGFEDPTSFFIFAFLPSELSLFFFFIISPSVPGEIPLLFSRPLLEDPGEDSLEPSDLFLKGASAAPRVVDSSLEDSDFLAFTMTGDDDLLLLVGGSGLRDLDRFLRSGSSGGLVPKVT